MLISLDGISAECVTCLADRGRVLRNSVHPDCWIEATKEDVDKTSTLVLLIYHALVVCASKVAEFQDSPDSALRDLEATGKLVGDVRS
jgi:hypothetical protein